MDNGVEIFTFSIDTGLLLRDNNYQFNGLGGFHVGTLHALKNHAKSPIGPNIFCKLSLKRSPHPTSSTLKTSVEEENSRFEEPSPLFSPLRAVEKERGSM